MWEFPFHSQGQKSPLQKEKKECAFCHLGRNFATSPQCLRFKKKSFVYTTSILVKQFGLLNTTISKSKYCLLKEEVEKGWGSQEMAMSRIRTKKCINAKNGKGECSIFLQAIGIIPQVGASL